MGTLFKSTVGASMCHPSALPYSPGTFPPLPCCVSVQAPCVSVLGLPKQIAPGGVSREHRNVLPHSLETGRPSPDSRLPPEALREGPACSSSSWGFLGALACSSMLHLHVASPVSPPTGTRVMEFMLHQII